MALVPSSKSHSLLHHNHWQPPKSCITAELYWPNFNTVPEKCSPWPLPSTLFPVIIVFRFFSFRFWFCLFSARVVEAKRHTYCFFQFYKVRSFTEPNGLFTYFKCVIASESYSLLQNKVKSIPHPHIFCKRRLPNPKRSVDQENRRILISPGQISPSAGT